MENTKKINKNSKIGVLCGGLSNEREVSLRSGKNVFKALIELGYKNVTLIDVDRNIASTLEETKIEFAFNVLHGRYGEDGCIQGVLEFLNIPYTGCSVMASSICMDKIMTKKVLSTNKEIPLIKSENATSKEEAIKKIKNLNFPIIIKPSREGSSIGMTKVNQEGEILNQALDEAFRCDKEILIEEYLEGKSATVGVLERIKDEKYEIFATPILGFKTKTEWYDYEAKYTKGLTEFILPADFDKELTEKIKKIALDAHKLAGCKGLSRVDFLVHNNIPYVLEINTNPGMTDTSDLPAQAKAMGIDYNELVDIILKTAELN